MNNDGTAGIIYSNYIIVYNYSKIYIIHYSSEVSLPFAKEVFFYIKADRQFFL